MTVIADVVIRGGTVVDGSGRAPYRGDVAIRDGRITKVGVVEGRGAEEIDAAGCIVTPGFVDVHTHYDGQAIWSDRMTPSSQHGVTTAVMGNCGVGFAPCRPADRETLIKVMEGVEDIPGVVMAEGLSWAWESFPQYLDALEARARDIDVAAYLPHSPLRVYVMGERGVNREAATPEDLARMGELVREAMAAGALGCATSRVAMHRTSAGEAIPSFDAAEAELGALMDAMAEGGAGLFQMVPDATRPDPEHELELLDRLVRRSGRPASFTFGAGHASSGLGERLQEINAAGSSVTAQVYPRPIGMVMSLALSWNPFSFCPSFAKVADLPLAEKVQALRSPELRRTLLGEVPEFSHFPLARATRAYDRSFVLSDPPNYEPLPEDSVAARASAAGVEPLAWAYDYLLQDGGGAMLLVALGNYVNGSLDAVGELLHHPNAVVGLGDGGAHYGLICDASYPTFMLTHWVRDRDHGRLELAWAVQALTRRPAELVGLRDRGLLAPGLKADVNVINLEALTLHAPRVVFDLPGGGKRLMQDAEGYRATLVNGEGDLSRRPRHRCAAGAGCARRARASHSGAGAPARSGLRDDGGEIRMNDVPYLLRRPPPC